MKVLFDQGTPVPLRNHLQGCDVSTLAEQGWSEKENGELLDLAERNGYEVLVTTDQNLRHQQNLLDRNIGVVVLLSTKWSDIRRRTSRIQKAIESVGPAEVREIQMQET